MKHIAILALTLALSACGNIVTVYMGDIKTSNYLLDQGSSCGAVPRVYSGVIFDFCMLYGEPASNSRSTVSSGSSAFPILFIDAAASGVLDTVVLPYTLYRQSTDGSIEISRRTWKRES
ncbi:YceK/YidQ family lipoprotein [Pseudomonas sp. Pseusp122]|uniref:YceK/YidQ family lipoprotein n=1 Tax=unclassified Pseudomonas TaxID=196821 RepID=UPI0039A6B75E